MKMVTNESEKALAQAHIDQAGFDALKDDLGVSRDKLDASSSETLDRLEEQGMLRVRFAIFSIFNRLRICNRKKYMSNFYWSLLRTYMTTR